MIMRKGSTLKEFTVLNVYILSNRMSKYKSEKLIGIHRENRQIHCIAGNINILLSAIDGSNRQKISKDTVELNSTINQWELINIYKIFHPTIA